VKRGDVLTVAVSGDYGKPRPAVVIQSDALAETDSILVCFITSALRDSPLYRLSLAADETTGLREPSQVMAEKIFAVRREKCGKIIGRLNGATMIALGPLLNFVVGLRD
jgi:mRNA interferase MazF